MVCASIALHCRNIHEEFSIFKSVIFVSCSVFSIAFKLLPVCIWSVISTDAIKEREKIFSVCVKLLKVQTLRHMWLFALFL